MTEKSSFFAPPSIEMLNLWNDFRKVVKFIDENPWVKPMLERIVEDKNRGHYNEKEVAISRNLLILSAPAGVELLSLWNDFRNKQLTFILVFQLIVIFVTGLSSTLLITSYTLL